MCLGAVFEPSDDSIEISIVRPPFVVDMSFSTHVYSIVLQCFKISSLIQTLTLLFITALAIYQWDKSMEY